MKSTRIKVSMSQDGSLSKETVNTVDFQFPVIPRKLLKSMGFEKVDDTTYVGIMSVFLNLAEKDQEIEVELGIEASDTRKKVMDFFKKSFRKNPGTAAREKSGTAAKAPKPSKAAKPSKTTKPAATKTSASKTSAAKPAATKTAASKTSKTRSAASKTAKPAAGKKTG